MPEFTFTMGVRGYHFYLKEWPAPSPYNKLTLEREPDNKYDTFAVAVKAAFDHKLAPIVVGHVPIEISRFIHFSMEHGCLYSLKVLEGKPVRSPLTQGGLEIKCIVTVNWASDDGVEILRSSIERNYSFEDRLVDDSKTLLQYLKNFHEVEEEIDLDFGLEVLEISETQDDEIENVEDNVDLIVIN